VERRADEGGVGVQHDANGIARFVAAGVDGDALAARLQQEGADAFVASWDELIENIGHKTRALTAA